MLYVFNRIEKKYLLSPEKYIDLMNEIREKLKEDEHGKTIINNIYYDTDDFFIVRESNEKPIYKEKLRLRSYGIPKKDSKVFLEIKKKYDGIGNKRRMAIKLEDAYSFVENNGKYEGNDQIKKEISYFISHYKVKPKVYIAYDREAFFEKSNKNFRITVDKDIRYRFDNLRLEKGDKGKPLFEYDYYLLEVKSNNTFPLWFVKALSKYNINQVTFSKYGSIYKKEILKEDLKCFKVY